MQANSANHQPFETPNPILGIAPGLIDNHAPASDDLSHHVTEPTYFHGYYTSHMDMYAKAGTVATYLDAHQDWFRRCAHPMKAESLGANGYALTIGRFGSFGYEVEPKIGLDLLPQDQGIYRIQTIPIPDYEPQGYEVDFRAAMHLVEADDPAAVAATDLTRVEWDLNLEVAIQFPRFIQKLPKSLVQSTGDRLLNQIVRQVSRRLTRKVQEDFHSSLNIPFSYKRKKQG
jgi:hypothetical protein